MLQLFHLDVANVDRGMLHMLHTMLQVFQRHVASVCSKSFICFPDVCCKHFDLNVAFVFTYMLQQYTPKYFICFSLLLQQVFSCCKLQVFYLDVAYVFTHMLHVYVPNISPVSDVCCKCFHIASCKCFIWFRTT
jgi:hypothetical protein